MFLNTFLSADSGKNAIFETEVKADNIEYRGGKLEVAYRDPKENVSGKHEADLVIAADGAHSFVRQTLCPGSPTDTGYVTWRGAVPERVMSPEAKQLFPWKSRDAENQPGLCCVVSIHVAPWPIFSNLIQIQRPIR
jgi:2-polyprenyl-6-methoxyphenol hydroxylase-like FAD-dependent oxidoreductase